MTEAWAQSASDLDEAQAATLLAFLERCNALSRVAIIRLREMPAPGEERASSPVAGASRGSLTVTGALRLDLRVGRDMGELYTAEFDGLVPTVRADRGTVTMRYPRRLQLLGPAKQSATITLNSRLPWRISVRGAASMIRAEFRDLMLEELEIRGAASSIDLQLPSCRTVVPVRISGGASAIRIRREPDAAAQVHLAGWASKLDLDGQTSSNVGNNLWLQSTDYQATGPYFAIELASSASSVSIERNAEA